MNKIPFEEQRVIDELVDFWQTRKEPSDITTHINDTKHSTGYNTYSFFKSLYDDLQHGKRKVFTRMSPSEVKISLENKCRQYIRKEQESKALLAKIAESKQIYAFEPPTVTIKEPSIYINQCWNCHSLISSDIDERCSYCKFFICSSCRSCLCRE